MKKVEGLYRNFVWSGADVSLKKPAIAWSEVCKETQCGGLGIKAFVPWNQALIVKQLWAIAHDKERLWVRWIHAYYIRGRNVLHCHILLDTSWMLRKIMGTRTFVIYFW